MKVSVIIPIYNGKNFIEDCCFQLASQTLRDDMEFILVNDGSTDGSGEICDLMSAKYHNCKVVHQINKGVSAARNSGLAIATGEYIGFVDVDDQFDTDMYECMLKYADAEKLDIVSMEQGKIHGHELVYNDVDEWMNAFFLSTIGMSVCSKLFRKSIIPDDLFPEGKRIHEDLYATYIALTRACKVGILNVNKYHYIHREGSSSRVKVFSEKYLDAIDIADKIYQDAKTHFPNETDSNEARKARTYLRISKIYFLRGAPEEYRQRINKLKEYLSGLDKTKLNLYYKKNDLIRYQLYLNAMPVFLILVKTIDRK
ncbi:glycosyltransferase [[Clostridium] aminophilum]|uniref:Glycosyltransferase involved in cell wall bisynthesis n=1 Tax=[Clostridium] aminophilum TaxID=1526 RepID=A0A1I6JLZ3_9FIRM|nr:glycosyltransferase [[Clostridium] aminophilum]SFR79580.1 Glycosyltransferase involved in cell wall bisynthesis [[Clostridium] aminophilum]